MSIKITLPAGEIHAKAKVSQSLQQIIDTLEAERLKPIEQQDVDFIADLIAEQERMLNEQ